MATSKTLESLILLTQQHGWAVMPCWYIVLANDERQGCTHYGIGSSVAEAWRLCREAAGGEREMKYARVLVNPQCTVADAVVRVAAAGEAWPLDRPLCPHLGPDGVQWVGRVFHLRINPLLAPLQGQKAAEAWKNWLSDTFDPVREDGVIVEMRRRA